MSALPRIALCLAFVACYEPEAVDCTVACTSLDDCAEGQICGADGFCAAPNVAGTCKGPSDEMTGEPRTVSLQVVIDGRGKVEVEGLGMCDSQSPSEGYCTFAVTAGVMRQLRAIENGDREFVEWTSTCTGESSTCRLTPVMPLTQVGAMFE